MSYPSFQFHATRPEETRANGSLASSPIHTLGHAALADDAYRTIGIESTDIRRFNVCFTDVESCAALARLIEGPISTVDDLERAEVGLQALLFHENVEIIIPTIKVQRANVIHYLRPDDGERSQLCFDVFNTISARDWLLAYDYCEMANGRIARTLKRDTALEGIPENEFREANKANSSKVDNLLPATAVDFKVAGYFSNPRLSAKYGGPQTFVEDLYDRFSVPWKNAVSSVPGIDCSVVLPPLLAVILNRAKSRGDLPEVLRELHVELGRVRAELMEFNQMVLAEPDQARLERMTKRIQESFDAIIPESREVLWPRRIAKTWKVVRPLAEAFRLVSNSALFDPLKFADLLTESGKAFLEDPILVDRTTTARTFAGLFKTKNLYMLMKAHFSEAELASLESSQQAQR